MIEIIKMGKNECWFKTDTDKNIGFLVWTEPKAQDKCHHITMVKGLSAGGDIINTNVVFEVEGKVNPSKVFWLVAKVLKKVLCPHCI